MNFKRLDTLVFRTPAYPLHNLTKNFCMHDLIRDPFFLSAIYIASPVLYDEVMKYKEGKIVKEVDKSKIEKSLLKYYLRMSSRCTPFGLFAACGMASFGKAGSKNIISNTASNMKRCSRLDMDYLCLLSEHLANIPEIQNQLTFYPNSSLYKFGKEWRYVGYHYKDGTRIHEINSISQSLFTNSILSAAIEGITLTGACNLLSAMDEDLSEEEITSYFYELSTSRVLISKLEPAITGGDFLQHLIIELKSLRESELVINLLELLTLIHEKLKYADQMDFGDDLIAVYKEIAKVVIGLNVKFEEARLFQVDSFWETKNRFEVNDNLGADLDAALGIFHLLSPASRNESLDSFKECFFNRYEEQEIPLLQVLDTESGIGYPPNLYSKTNLNSNKEPLVTWGWWEQMLSSKISHASKKGGCEIVLTEEDIKKIKEKRSEKTTNDNRPPSFSVMCREIDLGAADAKGILIEDAGGASAASILGRFAQCDSEIAFYVKDICAAEQLINNDVVFAEIIHLPQNRVGNVLLHPPFRDKEIPYLGVSSLPLTQQVSLNDLLLSVRNDKIFLRSESLNMEIIPRLSNSHNYTLNTQPIYNFLCDLQYQGISAGFYLNLGSLKQVYKVLPRIRYRNIILQPRQWSFSSEDLFPILNLERQEKYIAFREFCANWDLPVLFILADNDIELPVSVEDELQIDNFLYIIRYKKNIHIKEFLLSTDGCITDYINYSYNCQFIISYLRTDAVYRRTHSEKPAVFSGIKRSFFPGTGWVYLKIYCGAQTSDKILKECILSSIKKLKKAFLINKWFFIRYQDPDHHIRLRILHSLEKCNSEMILHLLYKYLAKYQKFGIVWKVTIDTYKREVERYKGLVDSAESVFSYDSDATLSFLCLGTVTEFTRWKYSVMSINWMLDSFNFSLEKKYLLFERLAVSFNGEFKIGSKEKHKIDLLYREKEKEFVGIMKERRVQDNPLFYILQERQKTMAVTAKSIMKHYNCRKRQDDFYDLISSFIHMLVNRIYPSNARYEEMIIYNQLERYYKSQIARIKHNKHKA